MNTQDTYLWSLCIWREARNSQAGMLAVAWVLWNRLQAGKWGKTMTDVVTERLQFSSMTALGDPETVVWPNSHQSPGDLAAWQYALSCPALVIGSGQSQDPTSGACFYFAESISKPAWAESMLLTVTIGGQEFYRSVA
jgi:spore germination cell wall hydrolase CwlJ-like protein